MELNQKQIITLISISLILTTFNIISYNYYVTGEAVEATIGFYINSAPYLNLTIPNQSWDQNTQLIGIDLDDHFIDRENDPINYSAYGSTFVDVSIDSMSHVVIFTPTNNWWGAESVWFNATDVWGATGTSNEVRLNVTYTPPPSQEPEGGGGDAGGGRASFAECIEQWVCKDWTPCIEGYQERKCRDLAHCGTNTSIPSTWRNCRVPSCSDRIQNQNETGVDCGGPCSPCKTCFDNELNCHDGECEEKVDCGGPCLPCELKAIQQVEFITAPWITLSVLLIVIFSIEVYLYGRKRKLREQQLPLRPKKMKEAAKKMLRYMELEHRKKK